MSTYHHGDLPRQLLDHAATIAAATGPENVTLRELARRAGVSHSAPVHHFGTRSNLLATLAADGFEALNEVLSAYPDDIYEMGVAYVLWALEHPGHYVVMWQPRHLAQDHERLNRARERAWALLASACVASATSTSTSSAGESTAAVKADAYAAFALVHGLAGIWLSGALPHPDDHESLAREITHRLWLTQ